MMGILPDVARSLGVSIPDAGHLISAYALGVCCGAPLLVIVHKYPLKNILLCLAGIILLGSTLAALSVNYWMLLVSRFISGLPHGLTSAWPRLWPCSWPTSATRRAPCR